MKRYLAVALLLAGCAPRMVRAPEKPRVELPPITLVSLLPRAPQSIAHRALAIEKEMGLEVPAGCYEKLERILETAGKRISRRMHGIDILRTIDSILRNDFGYEFVSEDVTLLSEALAGKKIDCDTASLVYLAIAEQHKLPLKGVSAPKHFFVRWEEGHHTFNWETTSGEEESDLHYVLERGAHPAAVENGVYLRSFEMHEVIAMAYTICGSAHMKKKRHEQAIVAFNRALELAPDSEFALVNKGFSLRQLKQDTEALPCFDRVLAKNPYNIVAVYSKALVLETLERFDEALEHYDMTNAIMPIWNTFFNKANLLTKLGRYEEAIPAYDRAAALNAKEESIYVCKGLCLSALGDYEGAIKTLDQALEINPESAFAKDLRQTILEKMPK